MDIGYKVVRAIVINKELKYFSAFLNPGKGGIEYKINKWVSTPRQFARHGYYLTYFNTIENANAFISHWAISWDADLMIFKCVASRPTKTLPPRLIPNYLPKLRINPVRSSQKWPRGTMMARRIKLIEEVEETA